MGIRIHKVLGYGVPNLKEVNDLIDFKKFRAFLDEEKELKDYLQFTKKNEDEIVALARGEWPSRVSDESLKSSVLFDLDCQRADAKDQKDPYKNGWGSVYAHYDFNNPDGYKKSTAMVVTPAISYKDWRRYDDIIDYMESDNNGSNQYVRVFDGGIFPYSGHHVRISPEGELPSHVSYYHDIQECDRPLYRPYVPTVIISMLLWPGAFKVKELLQHIRPMVMTYWS
jgi:hypothetical protein